MNCQVLAKGKCVITQKFSNKHQGIDLVGANHTIDNVVAHSDGVVTYIQDGRTNNTKTTGNETYGNYVIIDHQNNYKTLYAHLKKGIKLQLNQKISKGTIISEMSDSGNSYGKHLHFEVIYQNKRINPESYLNKSFISTKYQIGDKVSINGVYISSDSSEKKIPLITSGIITKILTNKPNPYLIDNGKVGWVNDTCIVDNLIYISNPSYKGYSIVDALKEINIDSSYKNREYIAKLNNIKDYRGTSEQNIKLLTLLKQAKLLYKN